jgi:hypothetical protein
MWKENLWIPLCIIWLHPVVFAYATRTIPHLITPARLGTPYWGECVALLHIVLPRVGPNVRESGSLEKLLAMMLNLS